MDPSRRLKVVATGSPDLERIYRILSGAPGVRTELVDDVRSQMDDGTYMSEEKLNLAIYRMLKDALR